MSASKRRLTRTLALAFIPYLLNACATMQNPIEVQLPAYASGLFVDCSSTNGALSFQFNRSGNTLEAADLEWAAKPTGDWGLASYSPFGQTLFQLKFTKASQSYEVTGRRGEWLNDVSLNQDGFLRYKGQKLGIRPDEFPCFFSGHLPRNWLRQVMAFTQDRDGLVLQVQDEERVTTVRIARHGGAEVWNWQVVSQWDVYWGLKRQSLTLQSRKDNSVTLSSEQLKDIECRWSPKEEE